MTQAPRRRSTKPCSPFWLLVPIQMSLLALIAVLFPPIDQLRAIWWPTRADAPIALRMVWNHGPAVISGESVQVMKGPGASCAWEGDTWPARTDGWVTTCLTTDRPAHVSVGAAR